MRGQHLAPDNGVCSIGNQNKNLQTADCRLLQHIQDPRPDSQSPRLQAPDSQNQVEVEQQEEHLCVRLKSTLLVELKYGFKILLCVFI